MKTTIEKTLFRPDISDPEKDEEIDVEVELEYSPAEPDVGLEYGYWEVAGVRLAGTKTYISITPSEEDDIVSNYDGD